MMSKLGFIGTGNMGAALVRGIIRSGVASPENVMIYDIDGKKAENLAKETGASVACGNTELVSCCKCIILAVKPAQIRKVLKEIKENVGNETIIVSIAAGITIESLKSAIGEDRKIARVMPNLPAMVGEGMSLVCFGGGLDEKDKALVRSIFEASGKVEELDERLMNEAISLTGSSPAYIFMLIEAMADGAVLHGIPRSLAYKLAAQSVLGSARMVLETGLHPAVLKDQVCSPAGTTIMAVNSLEKNGFRYSIMEAMIECTKKAREIGRECESR